MKKTLLCLAIGILSFYIGIFVQSLFYGHNIEVQPVEESEICNFDFSDNIVNKESLDKTKLYLPLGGDYYYNLPSSKGKHAPDFYLEGGSLYVRKQPSPIDLQFFEFESISVNQNKFSSVTKEIEGIKYSLEGKIPNGNNDSRIKIVLTKYQNGNLIYKGNVVFREAIPDC